MAELAAEAVVRRLRPVLDPCPGAPVRLGLVLLATDLTSERDFRRMLPAGVDLHVTRVAFANPTTAANHWAMAGDLERALALLVPDADLDVLVFGCTSAVVTLGEGVLAEAVAEGRPGVPLVTPVRAALDGLRRLGARRIALLGAYTAELTADVRDFLEREGLEVTRVGAFDLASDFDMARLSPDRVFEAAAELDGDDVDALFLSCTAMRAAEIAEALEERTGKPVVTSNTALVWQALRTASITAPVPGHGRLLRS